MAITKEQIDRATQKLGMTMLLAEQLAQLFERLVTPKAPIVLSPDARKSLRSAWLNLKATMLALLENPLAESPDGEISDAQIKVLAIEMGELLYEKLAPLDGALTRVRAVGEIEPLTGMANDWTDEEWTAAQAKLIALLNDAKAHLEAM